MTFEIKQRRNADHVTMNDVFEGGRKIGHYNEIQGVALYAARMNANNKCIASARFSAGETALAIKWIRKVQV